MIIIFNIVVSYVFESPEFEKWLKYYRENAGNHFDLGYLSIWIYLYNVPARNVINREDIF